ncbi:MAG: hypothetical protein AB1546_01895 [bacterium]
MRHHDVAFIYGDMSPYNKAVSCHRTPNQTSLPLKISYRNLQFSICRSLKTIHNSFINYHASNHVLLLPNP